MAYNHHAAELFASTRETSPEIADAILQLAGYDRRMQRGADLVLAQRIWAEPTADEIDEVEARAWRLADPDEDTLFWGKGNLVLRHRA